MCVCEVSLHFYDQRIFRLLGAAAVVLFYYLFLPLRFALSFTRFFPPPSFRPRHNCRATVERHAKLQHTLTVCASEGTKESLHSVAVSATAAAAHLSLPLCESSRTHLSSLGTASVASAKLPAASLAVDDLLPLPLLPTIPMQQQQPPI